MARAEELDAAVADRLREHTSEEWDDKFQQASVVGGAVRGLDEVLATGQPEARRLLSDVDSESGSTRVTNAGYLVDGEPFTPAAGPPTLGQHTTEILTELGYGPEAISQLEAKVVIKRPPTGS
jgi:crotonobetainyl-CoA:carnitine CoA-transferase CaiB-like acyl-CoA transferase